MHNTVTSGQGPNHETSIAVQLSRRRIAEARDRLANAPPSKVRRIEGDQAMQGDRVVLRLAQVQSPGAQSVRGPSTGDHTNKEQPADRLQYSDLGSSISDAEWPPISGASISDSSAFKKDEASSIEDDAQSKAPAA